MESATNVTITPTFNCDVTLYLDAAGAKIKLDGVTKTTSSEKTITFEASANTSYSITKGDVMNLFLIVFTPKATPAYQTGDVNGDGEITITDLTALIEILNGNANDDNKSANMNNDDKIDTNDVLLLLEKLLKP